MDKSISKREEEIQAYWKENRIFDKSLELARARGYPRFNFYEGPPFASGSPHLGHLITKTVKDSVIRYKSQNGYWVPRVAGWDTHGVPLETKGQQKLNLRTREDILKASISTFNQTCREIVLTVRNDWEKTTERFGQWMDFFHDYKTMDFSYMNSVWWVFKQLYDKNLVYRGIKVMPYSPACFTVWSNFEANQNIKEVSDPALVVKFPCESNENTYLLIFTTTPWTLPANLAVAVSSDLDYVYASVSASSGVSEVYVVEASALYNLFSPEEVKVLKTVKGSDLVGLRYRPLYPYYYEEFKDSAFRVLTAPFVSATTGTGLVHLAPGFGPDDFKVCLEAGIIEADLYSPGKRSRGPPCPIDDSGRYTSEVRAYEGLYVKDADKKIISELKRRGLVIRATYENHKYPFCWRTETPLLYRVWPCWFIKVSALTERLIENNKKITWVPEFVGKSRFGNWLESGVDWCVSRNRFWGTPIPIWTDANFHEMVCVGSVAELEEQGYRRRGQELVKLSPGDIKDLHRDFIDDVVIPSKLQPGTWLSRVDEIFDCWFESGSMPYASHKFPFALSEAEFRQYFPADFISESIDQVRGWFYTLSVLSTALFDQPAFKTCVVTGLVLAEDGQKMSKSKGNYKPPELIMDKYGADALRLYLLNSPGVAGDTLLFQDDDVKKVVTNVHIYLLNVVRFLKQMVAFYEKTSGQKFRVSPQDEHFLSLVDRWLLQKTQEYITDIHTLMSQYNLREIYPKITTFVQNLSNWYLKLNRSSMKAFFLSECPRVYLSLNNLYWALYYFSVMTAPFAPFLTESIFLDIRHWCPEHSTIESVHLIQMPTHLPVSVSNDLLIPFEYLVKVINGVRYLRGTSNLPARRPLKEVTVVSSSPQVLSHLEQVKSLLVDELNIVNCHFDSQESKYLKYTVILDPKTAGKKFRHRMSEVARSLSQMPPENVLALLSGKSIQLETDVVTPDDVILQRMPLTPHLLFQSEGDISVFVDTEMTPEIELRYVAKQLNRTILDFRKELGLVLSDSIKVYYSTDSDLLRSVLSAPNYLKNLSLEPYTGQESFAQTTFNYFDLSAHLYFARM